jgi:hypothetical protein
MDKGKYSLNSPNFSVIFKYLIEIKKDIIIKEINFDKILIFI